MGSLNHGPQDNKIYDFLFPLILKSCQISSSNSYQSFHALKIWSAKTRLRKSTYLKCHQEVLNELLNLINANWEIPLRGVPDLLADSLTNILATLNDAQLDQKLLQNAMTSLSWKTKAKYPLLFVLLPRTGVIETLQNHPDFASGLCQSLSTNHLASAGASLYKLIVKTPNIFDIWEKDFAPHFLYSLCQDPSPLVRCNAKNYWLSPTLSYLKAEKAASCMLEKLCKYDHGEAARFLILKGLRSNGLLNSLEQHWEALERGLEHSSSDVSIAAFAVICQVKKKGLLPTRKELILATNFILNNLTVDEAAFRQVRQTCQECIIHISPI